MRGFPDLNVAKLIEALGEWCGESRGHVLHDQNRNREVLWKAWEYLFESLGAAGGHSDGNDFGSRRGRNIADGEFRSRRVRHL